MKTIPMQLDQNDRVVPDQPHVPEAIRVPDPVQVSGLATPQIAVSGLGLNGPGPALRAHHTALSLTAEINGEAAQLSYPFHERFRMMLLALLYQMGPQKDAVLRLSVPGEEKPRAEVRITNDAVDWTHLGMVIDSESRMPISRDGGGQIKPPSYFNW